MEGHPPSGVQLVPRPSGSEQFRLCVPGCRGCPGVVGKHRQLGVSLLSKGLRFAGSTRLLPRWFRKARGSEACGKAEEREAPRL